MFIRINRPAVGLSSRGVAFGLTSLAMFVLCVSGCYEPPAPAAPAPPERPPRSLTILSPHNAQIRETFARGFANAMFRQRGDRVTIQWVARGTPECLAYAADAAAAQSSEYGPRPDVLFGGGIDDHEWLTERDLSRPISIEKELARIPAEVGGIPTRDTAGRWFATGLSTFGLFVNERDAQRRGIAAPKTWEDLADARFEGWLGIADPSASGSHRQCMVMIVQAHGWEQGWGIILRALANSRALVESSSAALQQTRNGVFLASFAVNFDGLRVEIESGGSAAYLNPVGATAITPDVISVLRTATDFALAEEFVRYSLGDEGQKLWGARPDGHGGAPLFHYPIDPAIYETLSDRLAVKENPYKTDFGLRFDLKKGERQADVLPALVQAACGANHVELQKAWRAVLAAGMPAAALRELTTPLVSEAQALEWGERYEHESSEGRAALIQEWSAQMAAKYAKVLSLLSSAQP